MRRDPLAHYDVRTCIAQRRRPPGPSTGIWYVLLSSTAYTAWLAQQLGTSGDIPIPGDFDSDGKTDLGLYRPSTGMWYALRSTSNYTTWLAQQWGASTDIPVLNTP